ncbi:PREDICTED: UNC93-like protein 1 [Tarenaya hassleriana]|uniref:UNC93-like protein 1 n=1 Tax=Tarenaya hassleriana TaxID=28532 RepID=UPI00053C9BCF|nr:PREDICTED: UNC93-like protein 1 [Tarenaya hassleriana]XP_010541512.1 PREDICTED: UNC93-like protein 1 [Tarenaya hassleriana]
MVVEDEDQAKAHGGGATAVQRRPWRFNSPLAQVSLMGLVCFCCPGMFNALSGMGGGGQVDPTAANNANTAVYAAFSIAGILGGGIYNVLGPRLTLAAGCSTYVLYAGSFLYYNHHHHQAFAIVAGALLGCGAGLLWAGEGAVMTSYPPPRRKGTYISLFWSIFNLGGVIGGLIPFVLNYHRSSAASVNDGTYVAFMCFMSAGVLLSLGILPPNRVVREDGSRCSAVTYSKPSTEAAAVLRLFLDRKMLLIVPAAWASNFFYSYQFNNVNGLLFNLRTRGFNNVFYWGAQMVGSVFIGYVMDFSFKSRRMRGFVGIAIVAVLGTAIWAGGLANQRTYSSEDPPKEKLDFKDSGSEFVGPFMLYVSYGLLDAMFQSMVYWVIGALADDSEILSRYSGFYKGVQSAGAAVAWQVDTHKVPLMSQLVVNWSLTTLSYPLLALLVFLSVKDEDDDDEKQDKSSSIDPSNAAAAIA